MTNIAMGTLIGTGTIDDEMKEESMSINQKVGAGFLIAFAVACTLCLIFLPDFAYGEPGRGIFNVLPGGSLFVLGIIFSLLAVVVMFVNTHRRKKGKPPV